MKPLWMSVARKTGYVLAGLIVFAAIIVIASRLLISPLLDKHRADFEQYASSMLDMPVKIGNVHVSWFQYQPAISLNDVTLFNKETKAASLHIKNVKLFFSIPASLWRWQPVPSGIMVSGSDIKIHQQANGEYAIQGFPSLSQQQTPYSSETKFADAANWISQQPRIILRDINVNYTGMNGEQRFVTLYKLNFENAGTEHQIHGKAILRQNIPTEVAVSILWKGEKADLATLHAKIYLYISGFSLKQWMKGLSWSGWQVNDGLVSAKIWASWNKGALKRVQTTFQTFDVNLYSQTTKASYVINRLSGNVGWKREGNVQIIAGDDVLIDLPHHLWPVTSFYLSLIKNTKEEWQPNALKVGYVDLKDVQTFLFASPPLLPEEIKKTITNLQLKGNLQNASLVYQGDGTWTDGKNILVDANFTHLSFKEWQGFPGLNNFSGSVKWDGIKGNLSFNTSRASFKYDSIFANVLNIDQLTGNIVFRQDPTLGWEFNASNLQLFNNDLAVNVNGKVNWLEKNEPIFDLSANFTVKKVNRFVRYLPQRILDKDLNNWLKQAFLNGEISSGKAIFRGKPSLFPFDNNDGLFSVSGEISNVDFNYAPGWPRMDNTNGKIDFTGRQIVIDVSQARIMNIPISNAHGVIPYLGDAKPQILEVEAAATQTDFATGLKFIRSSPLKDTLGKMFNDMEMRGPLLLTLNLSVPLNNPDATTVSGDIVLKDTMLNLVPWNININKLNGNLHFTEKGATAKEIHGQLFGKPLTFNLETIEKSKDTSIVKILFNNTLSISDIENWLKIPFSQYAQGATNVTGEIDLSFKAPIDIHLRSNLVGIQVNLPDQYSKKPSEVRNFAADINIEEKAPLRLKLRYGDLLGAALILENNRKKLNLRGANLQLGPGVPDWPPTAGLYITGNFAKLDWEKMKGYLAQTGTDHFGSMKSSSLALRGIDIKTDVLSLAGMNINQLRLQVVPDANNWNVNITSPDVMGQLQVPQVLNRRGTISGQFQRLNLIAAVGSTEPKPTIEVKTLPAISLVLNNVSYNTMPLGQIIFKAQPSAEGLNIRTLNIFSPRLRLESTGEWSQGNTRLQGVANSNRVSDLLNSFGIDARNFISTTGRLRFNLSWNDMPFSPSLGNLNGRANLDLGKGRIVDIGQESGAKMGLGRMLSIFSLQTIPRRLSFDFSDVFQKGYSFDSLKGDFNFQDGSAFTNNMRFDGPVARVDINGRIGLKNKDYNFKLSVTPYVTSSLPLAATLVGGPVIGAAAFAVNSIIGSQISSAVATYNYQVTGPWDNPTWQPIK